MKPLNIPTFSRIHPSWRTKLEWPLYAKIPESNKNFQINAPYTQQSFSHHKLKAIKFTITHIDVSHITIFSDSLSNLNSLQKQRNSIDMARKIKNAHTNAQQVGKQISYMWISGHCNIVVNKRADKAAKLAHSFTNALTLPYFSYHDIKKVISKDTHLQWEKEWQKMSTKLSKIKRTTHSSKGWNIH